MAQVCAVTMEHDHVSGQVFLNEERAKVRLGDKADPVDEPRYLDTGASNHMTGDHALFIELDDSAKGSIKFSDNSVVGISGHGTVMFAIREGEHRVLTDVYFIPRLKTSMISLGQLDENGCPTSIDVGVMSVRDQH